MRKGPGQPVSSCEWASCSSRLLKEGVFKKLLVLSYLTKYDLVT